MKKITRSALYLLLSVSVFLGCVLSAPVPASASGPEQMEVHFMDVGQGDATLVTCGGHTMLIDAGDDTKGTAIQNFEKDNKTYQKLIQSLDDKQIKALTPKVNSKYTLGTASITILAPNGSYDNPNDASIALLLKNGNRSFLFTGDAGEEAEQDILKTGIDISADVYKVGHHGSKYSTSKDFFEAVDPFYAVISCGEGNSYGHPHAETLNTLRTNGVKVYRTDEAGTIVASTDGKSISFNVPASDSWKAGEPTGSADSSAKALSEQVPDTAQPQKENTPAVEEPPQESAPPATNGLTYVLNTKTKKFHRPTCNSLPTTNRQDSSESRDSIIAQGYVPCKKCNP